VNIFFTYFVIYKRYYYKYKVNNISFSKDKFTDLLGYTIEYEVILNYYLFNMLTYFVNIVDIAAKTSKEFEYIGIALHKVFEIYINMI
jgi:hypothetical protein